MEWLDIGANLTHRSFDADREQVIERARAVSVSTMIVTGADLESSRHAAELARTHPGVLFATAGVHPHHADSLDVATIEALRLLIAQPQVVAVGECGLDYYRNFSPHAAQRRAFESQLRLAAESGRPVFLHQREAHADFVAQLRDFRGLLSAAVAHCFTGTAEELEDYLELGLSIGITGWFCDERRGAHLHELVRRIPIDRLMLETDAPYLMPRDLKPRPSNHRNEPMVLPHIGAAVARARGETPVFCAQHTTAHARAFFRLDAAASAWTS
jgi:TatD DNase family protein